MTATAFLWRWTGTAMEPLPRYVDAAQKSFEAGLLYRMDAVEERSWASHRHYFATLADLWQTLPERHAEAPWAASPEHLRAYALIATGWAVRTDWACQTASEARRFAAMAKGLDNDKALWVLWDVRGSVVSKSVAMSQSSKAMGREDFQKSKDDVLEFVRKLVEEG